MDGQVVQRQTAKDIFSLFICFCQPQGGLGGRGLVLFF